MRKGIVRNFSQALLTVMSLWGVFLFLFGRISPVSPEGMQKGCFSVRKTHQVTLEQYQDENKMKFNLDESGREDQIFPLLVTEEYLKEFDKCRISKQPYFWSGKKGIQKKEYQIPPYKFYCDFHGIESSPADLAGHRQKRTNSKIREYLILFGIIIIPLLVAWKL